MKKLLTLSAGLLAASILVTGCSQKEEPAADAPLVSEAQGLGTKEAIDEKHQYGSQFEKPYESTDRKIDFEPLDGIDWTVERVLEPAEGETLLEGDNFRFTAPHNMDYSTVVQEWVDEMAEAGWEKSNEVVPEDTKPLDKGGEDDVRNKPYSVDLEKGKTTFDVNVAPDAEITIIMNSQ